MAMPKTHPRELEQPVGEAIAWNSQITLSPLDSTQPSPDQESSYKRTMALMVGSDISDAALRYSGESPRLWHFRFTMDAVRDVDAIKRSVSIVCRGLAEAQIDIADLEFIEAHLARETDLETEAGLRKVSGDNAPVCIGDPKYTVRHALRWAARQAFNPDHDMALMLSANRMTDLAPAQTLYQPVTTA